MTIYDIAREAGVSASTVSRVINKKSNVSEETRRKVEALLKAHHYSPDAQARALVSQSSRTIGILLTDIRTAHHSAGIHYIESELAKLGYCCIIMNTGSSDSEKANYVRLLSARRVDGAVIIGSTFQSDAVKAAIMEYMPTTPVVILNGRIDLPNVYGIMADERRGMQQMVELLHKKGRCHPAFVQGNDTPSNRLKLEGFKDGMRAMYPAQPIVLVQSEQGLDGAKLATCQLMTDHPETDAIVYVVDLMAAGGLDALRSMGIDVPGRVAVTGIDNSIYSTICCPKLTTLDNKLLELSVAAAQNLIAALNGRPVTQNMLIFSSIVEREST